MTVVLPPRRTRWRFWATGWRVAPVYRPWVAGQLARPDYPLRRLWPTIALQVVLIVIPQVLLALATHSTWRLVVPALLLGFYVVYGVLVIVRRRPLRPSERRRLLAYHGVTADGAVTTPVSAWDANPLGKTGVALLCTQVLVLSSGVAVAADRIAAERACHDLPAVHAAALAAVIGRPVPGDAAAAFGVPAPIVAAGSDLVAAREVDGGLDGVHFVGAYVRDPSGQLVGPAVWRILDTSTLLNPAPEPAVDAQDHLSRQITPSTGYGGSDPADRALEKARSCAKSAR